jgi:hypothetical protein
MYIHGASSVMRRFVRYLSSDLLTLGQSCITLPPEEKNSLEEWLGEAFRETGVLVFVFVVVEPIIRGQASTVEAVKVGLGAFAVFLAGVRLGVGSKNR